ncbi:hypothetical protein DCO58_01495 [Helicobacter saguini]|uniref:Uncharacterized protein n=1 Tax=Helicobacter saguini TaxID=1548018 RepID=A0A347VRD4_9HELI|nr:hypothetical protein [Helicobacter saguini]MWV62943.1 hypothetical protein [Helicobacter saguini]MWV66387.1 hypothetical protein [Helicobacter saguini]MWV68741.1 hypothetical protein [Helicobacter saguini]MWV71708.1 hypothetical protein [Helicobacter saguini]TLD91475.1 hypothetical protein LS64_011945 [Helicobacter saguini]
MLFIIMFLLIIFTLSYFICWLIYRKVFKSQRKISKILVFIGGIGLIIFYYTPYSYYLEPSFWQFRNICKLYPKIYQANGGKLDEEYYNKVLRHFDTDLDSLDWEYIQQNLKVNDWGTYLYEFEKYHGRIYQDFTLLFNDNQARRDNIKKIMFYVNWDRMRPFLAGNEGTGFFLGSVPISCIYFKKD